MEDDDVVRVIEVLSQDGDFQASEPIRTENGLVLQVCPEHLVLWTQMQRMGGLEPTPRTSV